LVLNCGLGLMQHFLRLVDSGNLLRQPEESWEALLSKRSLLNRPFN
jgi:hypothetical protein